MFQAFARAVGGNRLNATIVRAKAIEWLTDHWDEVAEFAVLENDNREPSFDNYVGAMSQPGTWGDAVALHSLAFAYDVYVEVLKKDNSGQYTWLTTGEKGNRATVQLYLEGEHYENLIRAGDAANL